MEGGGRKGDPSMLTVRVARQPMFRRNQGGGPEGDPGDQRKAAEGEGQGTPLLGQGTPSWDVLLG